MPPAQSFPCPRCHAVDRVCRKLITILPDINSPATPSSPDLGHIIVTRLEGSGGERFSGDFLNGFYCDTCQLGFVSRFVLSEVGLSEADVINTDIAFTDTTSPDPFGYYGPRLGSISPNDRNA